MSDYSSMDITLFRGTHRFLSNFYPSPIVYDGHRWPTVEHAFQSRKTTDPVLRTRIQQSRTPSDAKRLGRTVPLRPGWDHLKYTVMAELVMLKFPLGSALALQLVATAPATLIEGNIWHDNTWGNCVCGLADRPDCTYLGQNALGKLLMVCRSALMDMDGAQ